MWGVEMGGSSAGDLTQRQDTRTDGRTHARTHARQESGGKPASSGPGAGARWAGEQTVQERGEGAGVRSLSGVEEMPHGGAEGLRTPALQTSA